MAGRFRQFLTALVVMAGVLVITRPASAQLEDFEAALASAGTALSAIQSDSVQLGVIAQQLNANTAAIASHNAVWPDGTCKYERNISECEPWMAAADRLNIEKAAIIEKGTILSNQLRDNRQRFDMAMAKIRVLRLLNRLQEWHDRDVMPCTTMGRAAAMACLDAAWERHP